MAHVNEVRTFYLDWNTSVLFRTAEWLKCRTVACTRNTHIIYFCEWIPEFRPLGTYQVIQICIVTCTSSSPLCPGFLPQVSCLDILSEFPKKVRILRCFAVLAKSWAPKSKFGLLPKRVWINKESSREEPFFNIIFMAFCERYHIILLRVLWFITNCDILGGNLSLAH